MIVFAAIAPHPPVLVKEIGKDNLTKLEKTQAALKQLEQELYAAKPDSIVIMSPHGTILDDAFNINLNPEYVGNFKEFGDFSLEYQFKSDYMTIQEIRAGDESHKKVPIVLTSQAEVDHGITVPLTYLLAHQKDTPIIPITYAGLDHEAFVEFGQFMNAQLAKINKRFAIIASADLSHKLTKDAPGGFSKKGAEFDKKILEMVAKKDLKGLVGIKHATAEEAGECGLRAIIFLLSLIQEINCEPEVLSYEGPFGVGYPVVNFKFS